MATIITFTDAKCQLSVIFKRITYTYKIPYTMNQMVVSYFLMFRFKYEQLFFMYHN